MLSLRHWHASPKLISSDPGFTHFPLKIWFITLLFTSVLAGTPFLYLYQLVLNSEIDER